MNRQLARAVIIKEDKLLVMFRNKFGNKYVTLPGGRIEMGETAEQAVLRKIREEAMIEVANPRLVFIDQAEFYGDQMIYYCEYLSGEPKIDPATHEAAINKLGKNLYEPGWLPLDDLPATKFLSPELRDAIIDAEANGWPDSVIKFTSKRTI